MTLGNRILLFFLKAYRGVTNNHIPCHSLVIILLLLHIFQQSLQIVDAVEGFSRYLLIFACATVICSFNCLVRIFNPLSGINYVFSTSSNSFQTHLRCSLNKDLPIHKAILLSRTSRYNIFQFLALSYKPFEDTYGTRI